jgi:DNA-binding protein YbaB
MSMAQLRTALLAVRRDLADVEGTATNDAATITAVVDGHGALRDLVLDPRVFRDADSTALSWEILETIKAAAAEAAAAAYRHTSAVLAR